MKYINKTLTDDEKIISFLKFHWWWFAPPLIIFFIFSLIIIIGKIFIPELDLTEGTGGPVMRRFFSAIFLGLTTLVAVVRWIEAVTTEQVLTNKRVFLKTGLIRRDTDELKKEAIETVSINQSVLGRILKFGDMEFTGRGGVEFKFKFVKNPTEVKREFENLANNGK